MKAKRFISICISITIILLIYFQIDFKKFLAVFYNCHLSVLFLSLAMVVPITLASAWRLQCLAPHRAGIGFYESNRLILAASTLNMVLPSKMGDLAKAYFIRDQGKVAGSLALSLVVFEKACDMLSLLLWCTIGLIIFPGENALAGLFLMVIGGGLCFGVLLLGSKAFSRLVFHFLHRLPFPRLHGKLSSLESGWLEMHAYFWGDRKRLFAVVILSIFTWYLHLLQIWLFIVALRETVPFLANLSLAPLAILAGLIPLTFAGIGTRDAALLYFYSAYMAGASAAALGVLCTLRYFLPALAGLPFLHRYVGLVGKRGSLSGQ